MSRIKMMVLALVVFLLASVASVAFAGGPGDGSDIAVWQNFRLVTWNRTHTAFTIGNYLQWGSDENSYVRPGQSFIVEAGMYGDGLDQIGKTFVRSSGISAGDIFREEPAFPGIFTVIGTGKIYMSTTFFSINKDIDFHREQTRTVVAAFTPAPQLWFMNATPTPLPIGQTFTVKVDLSNNVRVKNARFQLNQTADGYLVLTMKSDQGICSYWFWLNGQSFSFVDGSAYLIESAAKSGNWPLSDAICDRESNGALSPIPLQANPAYKYTIGFTITTVADSGGRG